MVLVGGSMKRITIVLMLLSVLLYGCYSGSEQSRSDASLFASTNDSEADPVESAYSEISERSADDASSFNSRYEPPEDAYTITHLQSLEEVISFCPQLNGSWRCGRHITTAKYIGNNVEAIDFLFDSDGFDVEFSTTEIMISGNKYALQVPWTTENWYKNNSSYSDLSRSMGYPEYEKLPLNSLSSDTYDYFHLYIQNTDEAAGAEMDFRSMLICMYDDNKLLLSIDDIVFIAERATDH